MEACLEKCPPPELLTGFALGKLEAAVAESVGAHLGDCLQCRRIAAETPPDSFIVQLRMAGANALREDADQSLSFESPASVSLAEESQGRFAATVSFRGEPSSHEMPSKQAFAAAEPDALFPPELIDHSNYRMIRRLGRGGMGTVYLAQNLLLDRLEALKIVAPRLVDRLEALQRFQQEIRAAARLQHPNIVAAYSAQAVGKHLVFAMEHVNGEDLGQVVRRRGPLPIVHATFYAYQVCLGLQHSWERKMVHRDIKPSNLMLLKEGSRHTIKILDFGLAKAYSEKVHDGGLTDSGEMLGTPDYVAPEQTINARSADIRADIYSLGCTLYFLLTGRVPFQRANPIGIIEAHRTVDPEPLEELRRDVSPELAQVLTKSMAKQPAQRYQSPGELATALKPFFTSAVAPIAVSHPAPIARASFDDAAPPREEQPTTLSPQAAELQSIGKAGGRFRHLRSGWFFVAAVVGLVAIGFWGLNRPNEERGGSPAQHPRAIVRSPDNTPVVAHLKPPAQSISEHLDRLTDTFEKIKSGESKDLDPVKEFNREMSDKIWIDSGTLVELLEESGGENSSDRVLELKGIGLREQLSGLAEAVNVKVRVLAGMSKGREVWIASERLFREPAEAAPQSGTSN
jgi:serine/threonine protein kinase